MLKPVNIPSQDFNEYLNCASEENLQALPENCQFTITNKTAETPKILEILKNTKLGQKNGFLIEKTTNISEYELKVPLNMGQANGYADIVIYDEYLKQRLILGIAIIIELKTNTQIHSENPQASFELIGKIFTNFMDFMKL